ncbi:polypeptide N-acetylgalactosaminyltransferase 5 [Trichomycterus rosablanca]|uniref:polypeptide N-acetylgalactosaminyltransferase 5 n=1 Tax=Trichomycterus rosablanca TaxID=2290929 RepID=UPI002F35CAE6
MKFRRYLRGSGRVLAFVFIASVVWLLFDMAALRLSISDVNGQLLKELVIKERELAKREKIKDTNIRKYPVHRDVEAETRLNLLEKTVVEVYRQEKSGRNRGEVNVQPKLDTKTQQTMKKPNRNEPNHDVNTKPESTPEVNDKKVVLVGTTKPPAGKKENIVIVSHGEKLGTNATKVHQIQPDLSTKIPQNTHFVNNSSHLAGLDSQSKQHKQEKPTNDVQELDQPKDNTVIKVDDKHLNIAVKPSHPRTTPLAHPDELLNSTFVRKSGGLHKVMSLDMTLKPRDAHAPGQFGQAAEVPPDMLEESRRRWPEGHFNVFLSEQIPVDRAIPDTRPPACGEKLIPDNLPTTSVIFCFVDEVWSTLLRSVHSVLNRSPPHLLKEILLVDDCSTKDFLKDKLDAYMSQLPKVRIIRLKERHGLIRARLAGAAEAKGDVLTFLDSHIECNVGWLEPLLERVYLDRRKVACPVIEVINDNDMSYTMVDNFQRGIFKWPLVFGWSTIPRDYIKKHNVKVADPIRCPVMAGGLFSIDKKYFYELGGYDPGLDVWGGENMELSFKIWMCGGEIEIIPCSRVGHIFRGENPYGFPKDRQKTVERNLARVAEVWLDDYKEVFYGHGYLHLLDKKSIDIGNLTEQIHLRQKLQCKSFKWYLESVYPELDTPPAKAEGLVFNKGVRKCLVLEKDSLAFETCDLSKQSQLFSYSWLRTLRHNASCLSPNVTERRVAVETCDNTKRDHRWLYQTSKVLAEHLIAEGSPRNLCLEAGSKSDAVYLRSCEASSPFQKWHFTHNYA